MRMTSGVGIDLVDIERFSKRLDKQEFINLVFTNGEIETCQRKKHSAQHFAGRFAAKEAYMKAIGTGWSKEANFKEIEIVNDNFGKPELNLSGSTSEFYQKRKFTGKFVSISHTEITATAIVIITS